ncbi:glycerophosphodiester phosphodiesterase [Pedobacter sp. BS3]|uniref:glycerophosphodiester phosphodiesterase family protein n=1 Tax=Pedobacter sp. BS3 TaxID=2567937 RepID=UPI0011EF6E56|nr:glycerophosphodiester phosphodiesterase family protein [Pedobacter sp. BS3]TZF82807.1 glycerophosphodiester phosphodiesterase [Pedobacter sp. BS3]
MKYITYHTIFRLWVLLLPVAAHAQHKFDKQAHRGGRGLMPENTIAAMKNAIDWGCTLEMDLYITKDSQLVVSHEPNISSVFGLDTNGKILTKADEKRLMLKDLTYSQIRKYDIGTKLHPEFPEQKKMKAVIPLFSELVDSVEAYAKSKHVKARYNIQPGPAYTISDSFRTDFVKRMMDIILSRKIEKRSMFQAFDLGMLETVHRDYPGKIKISYLVGASRKNLEAALKRLSFKPEIYSPYYKLVNRQLVEACHEKKIKVIPWTVNTKEEIDQLKKLGVDGIISDYPNLL